MTPTGTSTLRSITPGRQRGDEWLVGQGCRIAAATRSGWWSKPAAASSRPRAFRRVEVGMAVAHRRSSLTSHLWYSRPAPNARPEGHFTHRLCRALQPPPGCAPAIGGQRLECFTLGAPSPSYSRRAVESPRRQTSSMTPSPGPYPQISRHALAPLALRNSSRRGRRPRACQGRARSDDRAAQICGDPCEQRRIDDVSPAPPSTMPACRSSDAQPRAWR